MLSTQSQTLQASDGFQRNIKRMSYMNFLNLQTSQNLLRIFTVAIQVTSILNSVMGMGQIIQIIHHLSQERMIRIYHAATSLQLVISKIIINSIYCLGFLMVMEDKKSLFFVKLFFQLSQNGICNFFKKLNRIISKNLF